jgi:hypothetical protein
MVPSFHLGVKNRSQVLTGTFVLLELNRSGAKLPPEESVWALPD